MNYMLYMVKKMTRINTDKNYKKLFVVIVAVMFIVVLRGPVRSSSAGQVCNYNDAHNTPRPEAGCHAFNCSRPIFLGQEFRSQDSGYRIDDHRGVEQQAARVAHNHEVAGSSPAPAICDRSDIVNVLANRPGTSRNAEDCL